MEIIPPWFWNKKKKRDIPWCHFKIRNLEWKTMLLKTSFLDGFACFIRQDIIGKNKFWWDLTNNPNHRVVVLISTCKLLTQNLLKLNFIERFWIFSCMDLCKVGIIGGWLGDKSYLFISELSQELCWIACPYLQNMQVSLTYHEWYKYSTP